MFHSLAFLVRKTRLEKKSQKPVTRMKIILASLPISSDADLATDSGHHEKSDLYKVLRPASAGFLMSGL